MAPAKALADTFLDSMTWVHPLARSLPSGTSHPGSQLPNYIQVLNQSLSFPDRFCNRLQALISKNQISLSRIFFIFLALKDSFEGHSQWRIPRDSTPPLDNSFPIGTADDSLDAFPSTPKLRDMKTSPDLNNDLGMVKNLTCTTLKIGVPRYVNHLLASSSSRLSDLAWPTSRRRVGSGTRPLALVGIHCASGCLVTDP